MYEWHHRKLIERMERSDRNSRKALFSSKQRVIIYKNLFCYKCFLSYEALRQRNKEEIRDRFPWLHLKTKYLK